MFLLTVQAFEKVEHDYCTKEPSHSLQVLYYIAAIIDLFKICLFDLNLNIIFIEYIYSVSYK